MQVTIKRNAIRPALLNVAAQKFLSRSGEELLKSQGKHPDLVLLRRNDNAFDVLFNRNERTRLKNVKTSISNQIFDCFACLRKTLNLIENNKRLTQVEWCINLK